MQETKQREEPMKNDIGTGYIVGDWKKYGSYVLPENLPVPDADADLEE